MKTFLRCRNLRNSLIGMFALGAASALVSPVAKAQSKPTASPIDALPGITSIKIIINPPNDKQVAEWFAKGSAAHEAGKFAEAEAFFLKVWAAKQAWDVAANLGLAQVNLGKHVAAAENLSYALRWFPASEPDSTKAVLERRLAAARTEVVLLTVSVNVEGAEVIVNGEKKGISPLQAGVFAAPGTITVTAQKNGYEPSTTTVEGPKGGIGLTRLSLSPKADEERSRVPAYVAGGAGVAGLIAGAVLFGLFKAGEADVRERMPRDTNDNPLCQRPPASGALASECAALEGKTKDANTLGNSSIALFAIGGLGLSGGVGYFLWARATPEKNNVSVRVVPVASNEGGGLVFTGAF